MVAHLYPAGQTSHVPLPLFVLYEPNAQLVQDVSPGPLKNNE